MSDELINEIKRLKTLIQKKDRALQFCLVGSCTCNVKTPELKHHGAECRYRIVSEALVNEP